MKNIPLQASTEAAFSLWSHFFYSSSAIQIQVKLACNIINYCDSNSLLRTILSCVKISESGMILKCSLFMNMATMPLPLQNINLVMI